MQRHPELLLFDLGGVLVEFSGFRDLHPLLRVPLSEATIRQQWIACPTLRAFEIGHLTPQQFAERFVATWDVAVSPATFLREFRTWTRGLLPGAGELLATLRGQVRLACLSNSNATPNPYEDPRCQDVAGKLTFQHLALRLRAPQTPRAVSGLGVLPRTRLPPA